jgi:hypothetical protein
MCANFTADVNGLLCHEHYEKHAVFSSTSVNAGFRQLYFAPACIATVRVTVSAIYLSPYSARALFQFEILASNYAFVPPVPARVRLNPRRGMPRLCEFASRGWFIINLALMIGILAHTRSVVR